MAGATIASLKKKYGSFRVPVFYIKAGSAKLEDDDIVIESLNVELTTGFEASACNFEVTSSSIRYMDGGGVSVHKMLEKNLIVGNKLEIKMGYIDSSKTVVVFVGYITEVSFELSGGQGFRYSVTGMDFKVFMMNNLRSELKKDVKKYSDAVSGVLKNYSSMMDGSTVEATPEMTLPVEQHRQSDYDFVVDLAKRLSFEFFVVAGKALFRPYAGDSESQLTVAPGSALYSFRREVILSRQIAGVVVRTNNEQDPTKAIEAKVTTAPAVGSGSKTGKQLSKLVGDKMIRTIIDNSVASEQEAKARAEAELLRLSMDLVAGEIVTVGLPELVPGKFITVENVSDAYNKDYYITRVTHVFDGEGYKTRCQFGANKA